jgi:hypothetical protein
LGTARPSGAFPDALPLRANRPRPSSPVAGETARSPELARSAALAPFVKPEYAAVGGNDAATGLE